MGGRENSEAQSYPRSFLRDVKLELRYKESREVVVKARWPRGVGEDGSREDRAPLLSVMMSVPAPTLQEPAVAIHRDLKH